MDDHDRTPGPLRREELEQGLVERRIAEAERQGLITRLSPALRRQALERTLARFGPQGPVWLFGYGSLMWNPCIEYLERRSARLHGYHRSFCLRLPLGRGTPERPGLMLALEPGGSCHGVALRIDPALAEVELGLVFTRELATDSYHARIVRVHTAAGPARAVTFVVNRANARYAPGLSPESMADVIAVAGGSLGSCADYLLSTVEHLDQLGVSDGPMRRLMHLVRSRQEAAE